MIDLRSDTVTKPTDEMRQAMMKAEVGDDVYGDDPTVNQLEERAAKVLGKEAAIFVTSGTQGNQIAVLTYTNPGEEIILEQDSHLFYYEVGGIAALAGVQTRPLKGIRGQIAISDIRASIRDDDIHLPKTSLISIENTHNRGGGVVLPISYMEEVYQLAQSHRIPVHLDGARIFNAAVFLGVPVKELTKFSDSVQVCLSKGLSAPVGSILAGPKSFIDKARKIRKRLGGGMRQAGVIAAPGLVALNQLVNRLKEDHDNATMLAEGLAEVNGIEINLENVETNMVYINLQKMHIKAADFVKKLNKHHILANAEGAHTVRFVTHRGITEQNIETVIEHIKKIVKNL